MSSATKDISEKLKKEIKAEFLKVKIRTPKDYLVHNSSALQYADAMFQISVELGIINDVRKNFQVLIETLINDKEIFTFFNSNFTDIKIKIKILNKAYRDIMEKEVFNLISILLERNLIKILEDIIQDYERLTGEFYNIYKVKVTTAKKIQNIKKLEDSIVKLTGHDIDMTIIEDASLISGIVVDMGGIVYDYSIKNELGNLKKLLMNCDISGTMKDVIS